MTRPAMALAALALALSSCGSDDDAMAPDATTPRADAALAFDARPPSDGPVGPDAAVANDAASAIDAAGPSSLSGHRDRLLSTLGDEVCSTWASFDQSQRAVFLTLTHRLFLAGTPDGEPAIAHLTRLHLVLGGGADGGDCGGAENNRLFLSMDDYLWQLAVDTWEGGRVIDDGGGSTFLRTRDVAGPHDPFDASIESDVGLRCALLIETSESRPPTAQAHFFLEGSEAPVERGSGISLPADPRMLEIDHDFDCVHRSNPTCSDFEEKYRRHYGDFECEWTPSACEAVGTGCYRDVAAP